MPLRRCADRRISAPINTIRKPNSRYGRIWMTESNATAELAFDAFIESYTPK
jgi:hypothetical protein